MTGRVPTARIPAAPVPAAPVPAVRTTAAGTRAQHAPPRRDWLLLAGLWQALVAVGGAFGPVPVPIAAYWHDPEWSHPGPHDSGWSDASSHGPGWSDAR